MAYPDFIAAGAIASVNGTSVTPTPPTHQADDILLIAVYYNNLGTISSATGGWTKLSERQEFAMTTAWFWTRATGSGTAGATATVSSGGRMHTVCYVIRGCVATGTPFEDATIASGNGTSPDTSTIDTTGADRMAAVLTNLYGNSDYTAGYPPTGWTNESNLLATGVAANVCRFSFLSKDIASASTVSAVSAGTINTGGTGLRIWTTLTLAFIPA
jgi:hypothetical protein